MSQSHVVRLTLTLTFDEMDGSVGETAEMAVGFLNDWSEGFAFDMTIDEVATESWEVTK